jgi:hypothetical protein
MPESKIKTYVLVGPDPNPANHFNAESAAAYAKHNDYTIIRYDDLRYKNFAQAMAAIKPPANVVLQCHGQEDGTFLWQTNGKTQPLPYDEFFSRLPRAGIPAVTIDSCFGGSAESMRTLAKAPPGTLVFSATSDKSVSTLDNILPYIQETNRVTTPIARYLKILDNFNPKTFFLEANTENREGSIDPNQALPHVIGIGGHPPQIIDLDHLYPSLKGKQSDPAYARAVKQVQSLFDTNNHRIAKDGSHYQGGSLGPAAEQALHRQIADIADRLAHGQPMPSVAQPSNMQITHMSEDYTMSPDERRIVYAITAAYLDKSGQLQQRIENAKHPTAVHNINAHEQAYLDTVQQKLAHDPVLQSVVAQLTQVFSSSAGDDQIVKNSALDHTLQSKGISTKGWTR